MRTCPVIILCDLFSWIVTGDCKWWKTPKEKKEKKKKKKDAIKFVHSSRKWFPIGRKCGSYDNSYVPYVLDFTVEFKFRVYNRISAPSRRIASPRAAGYRCRVVAYESAQKPARLGRSPSWKHSPVVVVVSSPSLPCELKRYRALCEPRSHECTQPSFEFRSRAVHRSETHATRHPARTAFRRVSRAAWSAPREIIKREREPPRRKKETGDSLDGPIVRVVLACRDKDTVLLVLKCLTQISTLCCASVATLLPVGKWVISRRAITPLLLDYCGTEKKKKKIRPSRWRSEKFLGIIFLLSNPLTDLFPLFPFTAISLFLSLSPLFLSLFFPIFLWEDHSPFFFHSRIIWLKCRLLCCFDVCVQIWEYIAIRKYLYFNVARYKNIINLYNVIWHLLLKLKRTHPKEDLPFSLPRITDFFICSFYIKEFIHLIVFIIL